MFVCLCVSMFHLLSITGLFGDCWAVKTFREKKVNLSKQGCWVWHRLVISILSKISFFIHKRLWSWFSNTLETFHTFHTCHTCHTLLSVQRRCHTFPNLSLLVVLQTRRKLVNEFAYQQLSSHLQLGDLHFNTTYDIEERSKKLNNRVFFLFYSSGCLVFLVLVWEEKREGVYFHFQDEVREAAFVLTGNSRTNGCCALSKSFQNKKWCYVPAASVNQKLTCCCSRLCIGGTCGHQNANLGVKIEQNWAW